MEQGQAHDSGTSTSGNYGWQHSGLWGKSDASLCCCSVAHRCHGNADCDTYCHAIPNANRYGDGHGFPDTDFDRGAKYHPITHCHCFWHGDTDQHTRSP